MVLNLVFGIWLFSIPKLFKFAIVIKSIHVFSMYSLPLPRVFAVRIYCILITYCIVQEIGERKL